MATTQTPEVETGRVRSSDGSGLTFTRESLEAARKQSLEDLLRDYPRIAKQDLRLDFTPESLDRLEPWLIHSPEEYRRAAKGIRRDGLFRLKVWGGHAGVASYFGEVLTRNLGGRWEQPSESLVASCQRTGSIDPIFHNWYVIVGTQKIPVFEIAGRRNTRGPSESLTRVYGEIVEGHYKSRPFKPHVRRLPLWMTGGLVGVSALEFVIGTYLISQPTSPVMKGVGATLIIFGTSVPIRVMLRRGI